MYSGSSWVKWVEKTINPNSTQPNPTQNKISIQPNTTQHLQGVGLNSVSFIGLVSWMHTP